MDKTLSTIRRSLPKSLFNFFQPAYHLALAFFSALWYGFPSKSIKVIGVTGTKGKSSTVEILSAILEEAGWKTALSNTIRFKVGGKSRDNLYKMSMPGRFFVQRLLREAVSAGCDYIILEMTSQGSLQHRHRFIDLDALVFTNISPEHIEAHGSYEKYLDAKLDIGRSMEKTGKKNTAIIANADDKESNKFLAFKSDRKVTFSLRDAEPYKVKERGIDMTIGGIQVSSPLSGLFNIHNILAAAAAARSQGVSDKVIVNVVGKFSGIPGRVERIEAGAGQDFTVIVDYAHTPDSLEKLYQVFEPTRKICVLGGTGGGRDSWKRKEMGRIADKYCAEIILTDEDPYDEDPRKIVDDVAEGITAKKPSVIMDRREAIAEAIRRARTGDTILITGKGTDPYIMGPNDSRVPWSDANVAREELKAHLGAK